MQKTVSAAEKHKVETILLAGGVSANKYLRNRMIESASEKGLKVIYPPIELCTDNGAMIGAAAHYKALRHDFAPLTLNANQLKICKNKLREIRKPVTNNERLITNGGRYEIFSRLPCPHR